MEITLMRGRGNVNEALKLLANIAHLHSMVRLLLKQKHPKSREKNILSDEKPPVYPVIFKGTDAEMIKTTVITEKGSGLSGLHADGWRKILVSNS